MGAKPYQAYKDSGVEWIGEIPEHWDVKRFSWTFRERSARCGDNPQGEMLSVSGYHGIQVKHYDLERSKRTHEELALYTVVQVGDLVLNTMWLNYGGLGVSEHQGYVSPAYKSFIFIQHTVPRYMHQLLRSHLYIGGYTRVLYGIRPNSLQISREDLKKIPVLFPPLEEQKLIVSFLDRETGKMDTLVEHQQQLITLLKEKRQSLISHTVTKGLNPNVRMKDSGVEWIGAISEHWEVKRIGQVSPVQRGASPRPIDNPVYFDDAGEYGWVRISDVSESNGFLASTTQRLSTLGASLSVRLSPGEIILSIAGSVGKSAVLMDRFCIHDGFVYFPKLSQPKRWLYYIFESQVVFGGLGKLGTQLNLNTETVKNISIPFPSQKERTDIIAFLDTETSKIDTLIDKAKQSISLLKERRSSLISAAVTGKIDVREAS